MRLLIFIFLSFHSLTSTEILTVGRVIGSFGFESVHWVGYWLNPVVDGICLGSSTLMLDRCGDTLAWNSWLSSNLLFSILNCLPKVFILSSNTFPVLTHTIWELISAIYVQRRTTRSTTFFSFFFLLT